MTTIAEPAVLDVQGVSKRFAGVLALADVSIELRAGQVHALVGENGAGKSTLIKVLTGVHQPDQGSIVYRGEPVSFARPLDAQAAGISTIYQEVNLVPLMSVARNLFLGREPITRLGLIDFGRMHREASASLARYGIHVDVRRPLRQLGTGRAADGRHCARDRRRSPGRHHGRAHLLARAPRGRAPDGGRRPPASRTGVAVVYVSHRLDEVFRLCDVVTVLRDGRRVHTGPIAQITRLELVSKMLGRELSEVARARTRFGSHDTTQDTQALLRATGLTRRHVLDGVTVEARAGEVVGLAGLLGSGRTETAKAIYGAQPLDDGAVEVAGEPVKAGSPRAAISAGIALIPEDRKADGIIPTLSVRENIVLAALPTISRAGFVSERQQDALVEALMSRLRIKASSPDQRVSELSGGNQQKVLLARVLCLEPRVLLLDDPTRGIDVGAKAEIQGLISDLAEAGLAVVLISSELEEVVEGADRIIVLRDGAVVGTLSGAEVTQDGVLGLIAAAAQRAEDAGIGPGGRAVDDPLTGRSPVDPAPCRSTCRRWDDDDVVR